MNQERAKTQKLAYLLMTHHRNGYTLDADHFIVGACLSPWTVFNRIQKTDTYLGHHFRHRICSCAASSPHRHLLLVPCSGTSAQARSVQCTRAVPLFGFGTCPRRLPKFYFTRLVAFYLEETNPAIQFWFAYLTLKPIQIELPYTNCVMPC